MGTMQPISGQPVVNNGGTILNAGNHDGENITSGSTLISNLSDDAHYGSVVSSGVDKGVVISLSGKNFANKMEQGHFITKTLSGQKLAGVALAGAGVHHTGSNTGHRRPIHRFYGYERLDITSWDYVTGAATVGGANGSTVLASGIDGATGLASDQAANPTNAIPGTLVYMTKGVTATTVNYKARTNP